MTLVFDTQTWRYKREAYTSANTYETVGYDDSAWDSGVMPFGSETVAAAGTAGFRSTPATEFLEQEALHLRGRIDLPAVFGDVTFAGYIDNGWTMWVNGVQVFTDYSPYNHADTRVVAASYFTSGANEIYIKVVDDALNDEPDYAFIDLAVSALLPATGISGGDVPTTSGVFFLKFEAPDGDVLLSEGGMLKYNGEVYNAEHAVFGAINDLQAIDVGFGDLAGAAQFTLQPNGKASVSDWWRADLFDCRVRIWTGALEPDFYNVLAPTLLADMVVDTYERRRGAGGEELLALDLVPRAEKLFLRNEGNTLSQRFHQSIWPGEKGLNNCTDTEGYFAWGARTPQRGSGGSTSTYVSRITQVRT